jgi:hypothetical protein
VVCTVEVFAIPARREEHSDSDTTGAILLGEYISIVRRHAERIWLEILARVAAVLCHAVVESAKTASFALLRVADDHAEAWSEGSDVDRGVVWCHVVDCHAAVLFGFISTPDEEQSLF